MGELDLDQIERLWGPGQEKERPREERPLLREPEAVREVPPPRCYSCKRLMETRK